MLLEKRKNEQCRLHSSFALLILIFIILPLPSSALYRRRGYSLLFFRENIAGAVAFPSSSLRLDLKTKHSNVTIFHLLFFCFIKRRSYFSSKNILLLKNNILNSKIPIPLLSPHPLLLLLSRDIYTRLGQKLFYLSFFPQLFSQSTFPLLSLCLFSFSPI